MPLLLYKILSEQQNLQIT